MPLCPEHNLEAVIKDKIRNKTTGRLYPPFFGCPWTGEDTAGKRLYCNHRFEERPSQANLMAVARQIQQGNETQRDRAIKYMNALKIASELIAAGIIKTEGISWNDALKEVSEIIFDMNPPER